MTEQVYQCAKVARPSPSRETMQENGIETHRVKINTKASSNPTPAAATQQEPAQEPSQTHTDMKENIIAALRGFMSMGIYMCGPSREDPERQESEQEDLLSLASESVHEQHEEEKTEEKIDSISLDDYIFEDASTDDGHIGVRVTIHPMSEAKHSYLVPARLGPIPEEENKEEPSTTRLHDDIFEFSDNETESPSCVMSEKEGCKEEEECKEEQSQGVDSLDFHMMDDFDLVETNFYGSKSHWKTQPRLLSPTRFEI